MRHSQIYTFILEGLDCMVIKPSLGFVTYESRVISIKLMDFYAGLLAFMFQCLTLRLHLITISFLKLEYRVIASGGVESSNHPLTVLNINSSDILKAGDQTKILVFIDIICGGYGIIMSGVCLYIWLLGQSSYQPFLGVSLFVAFNLVTSAISRLPWISKVTTESIRSVIGPLVAAAAFVLTIELFNGWWMGFMIMCMGGNTLHTMLTQKPNQGRLLIGVYTAVLLGCVFLFIPDTNKYHVMLFVGAIAMTGLLFAELLAQYSNVLYQIEQSSN